MGLRARWFTGTTGLAASGAGTAKPVRWCRQAAGRPQGRVEHTC